NVQSEFHPERVHVVGEGCQAIRKLFRIGVPFTDLSRPSEIQNENLSTGIGSRTGGASGGGIVYLCGIAPRVVHHIRELVGVRQWNSENIFGKALSAISGFVPVSVEQTQEALGNAKLVA